MSRIIVKPHSIGYIQLIKTSTLREVGEVEAVGVVVVYGSDAEEFCP